MASVHSACVEISQDICVICAIDIATTADSTFIYGNATKGNGDNVKNGQLPITVYGLSVKHQGVVSLYK
ncbi:hypothetical protein [Lysinibacillus piscis]|uniref:Uncharacterized protein n=1 Tax=Lysinibacillus piscis TaxID=2518931 RepID=A0ABQ5NFZ1_9BACI|nr:hypothetical protein [Lysinibacillus sp. KH24]GLC86992.1 hypothetical protein LYSBPC_01190 [Lysinibacillus sp. KH24]